MIYLIIIGVVLFGILLYMFPLIKVCGDSMYPTYKDGDILLSRRITRNHRFKKGCIYVYEPPVVCEGTYVIKRLYRIDYGSDNLVFVGDNYLNSYDSRSYGPVCRPKVRFKILFPREYGGK